MKIGAPGGCPTSSLKADVMNSPQSQKLAVGSMVTRYTTAAMTNMTQPVMLLIDLYEIILYFVDLRNQT